MRPSLRATTRKRHLSQLADTPKDMHSTEFQRDAGRYADDVVGPASIYRRHAVSPQRCLAPIKRRFV